MPGVREVACPVHNTDANNAGPRLPPSRTRFYRTARRIAGRMQPNVAQSFTTAIRLLQDRMDISNVRRTIQAGSTAQGVGDVVLSSADLAAILNGTQITSQLQATATATGQAGVDVLKASTGLTARFNALHPDVVLYARQQAGALIVGINDDVREAVRIVLAIGQAQGLTVVEQARAIREIVGLPPNWAAAPLNLAQELREGRFTETRRLSARDKQLIRSRLAAGTVDSAFIADMQKRYSDSLIHRRALNISRTETLRAANHGQREGWKQARDAGVLPSNTRRVWIVTPDDRLRFTHAQVPGMNPNGVEVDQPFMTPLGPSIGPPLETNCRCGEGLIFLERKNDPRDEQLQERARRGSGGSGRKRGSGTSRKRAPTSGSGATGLARVSDAAAIARLRKAPDWTRNLSAGQKQKLAAWTKNPSSLSAGYRDWEEAILQAPAVETVSWRAAGRGQANAAVGDTLTWSRPVPATLDAGVVADKYGDTVFEIHSTRGRYIRNDKLGFGTGPHGEVAFPKGMQVRVKAIERDVPFVDARGKAGTRTVIVVEDVAPGVKRVPRGGTRTRAPRTPTPPAPRTRTPRKRAPRTPAPAPTPPPTPVNPAPTPRRRTRRPPVGRTRPTTPSGFKPEPIDEAPISKHVWGRLPKKERDLLKQMGVTVNEQASAGLGILGSYTPATRWIQIGTESSYGSRLAAHRLEATLQHEIGHAMDHALMLRTSATPHSVMLFSDVAGNEEVRKVIAEELAALAQNRYDHLQNYGKTLKRLYPASQHTPEIFADAYAVLRFDLHPRQSMWSSEDFREMFPRTLAVLEKYLGML